MRLQMLLQMLLPHANANATAPICSALTRQNRIAGESRPSRISESDRLRIGSDTRVGISTQKIWTPTNRVWAESENQIAWKSGLTLELESQLRKSDRLRIWSDQNLKIWSPENLVSSNSRIWTQKFWNSGILEFWKSENLFTWKSGLVWLWPLQNFFSVIINKFLLLLIN